MKIDILGKGTRLAMAGTILTALAACATTQPPEERPVVQQVEDKDAATTAVTPPPPPPQAAPATPRVSSTASELQGLIQARQVSELRTAYNGSYGASLLFKPDDQTYFVVLFQHKDFWRVIKTRNAAQAESTYRAFVARSSELAGIEIKRILLQAEYNQAEQQLAARNAELASLQADQTLRQEQEQQVAARQEQSIQETRALTDQNKDVHQQLRALQRQIDTLQAEQMRINTRRK